MTTVTPVPRSRGSLSGLILILLGAWAGLAPFVGPYLFGLTPDIAWKVTDGRIYLSALPGGIALFCGLLITASSSRGFGGLSAFVAAVAGGWLIVGNQVINMLPASVAASINKGGLISFTGATTRADLLGMSTFTGVGALIVFFAAIALGRFSVVAYKDVLRYGTNLTAASGATGSGPLGFDPFASSGTGPGAALFTQPQQQPQFYPGQQQYPSQYPPDSPGSSATITSPFPSDQEPPTSLSRTPSWRRLAYQFRKA
jgi:hypothetical protein